MSSKQESKTSVVCPKITDINLLVRQVTKQLNLTHVHTIGRRIGVFLANELTFLSLFACKVSRPSSVGS